MPVDSSFPTPLALFLAIFRFSMPVTSPPRALIALFLDLFAIFYACRCQIHRSSGIVSRDFLFFYAGYVSTAGTNGIVFTLFCYFYACRRQLHHSSGIVSRILANFYALYNKTPARTWRVFIILVFIIKV